MKLLIVRHAETNLDFNGLQQSGGVIGALSEKGKIQAELLAKHLSSFKVSYIYSSDILRAVATSYVISDGMPDITVMLTKDLRIKDPDESSENFQKKIEKFLKGLCQKYDKQIIVIVSHSDVMQVIFGLLGSSTKTIPDLASVSEFDVSCEAESIVLRMNDTKYLS